MSLVARCRRLVVAACVAAFVACDGRSFAVMAAEPARLELKSGDHICLIGNTLAERMQHDGWLETYLHSRFPKHELVIRNLGFSGDELTLRLRSKDFGTPDEHLAFNKADVIFAFFGYNESFAGEAGLPKFRADLGEFVKHTLTQKYNGTGAPRLVLFSPIGHEYLHDRNLPDGGENNARLAAYSNAIREVAQAQGVVFVDLLAPTLELYKQAKSPLTINGIHLNAEGNRQLAQVVDRALFAGAAQPTREVKALEALRQAIVDKNFYWFNRYRTVDGYSIYGGRADLAFVDGQTNRIVMQRELEVLDAMTANRDRRIWAAAQGKELAVDDGNTPEFIEVKTNKPGAGPNGAHLFDGAEASISKMRVAPGYAVNLFASEEQFPELANPVQMAFDTRGRLWVAVMPSYPHWKPKEKMDDKIVILEDTNGDGKADVCKTFAEGLHVPTGLEFWNGGLFVGAQPDLLFLKDTDGDDKADVRVRMLHGVDSADTHHAMSSFTFDPGGALYFQEGTFHHTQVETPWGPPVRCANAGVFRYEPRTQKFDAYTSYPFANPHGHVFDRWGQDIIHDGTGAVPYHGTVISGHVDFPIKHAKAPTVYKQWTRPCPGTEFLVSRHFPDDVQGNLLVGNVIGYQGILQYKIRDKSSSFEGIEGERLLSSTDPNFRPTDLEIGPDGAIYFSDWQNPIIGHMQHNLRDPSRDRTHGRVYRLTYPGRPLLTPAKIAGEPIEKLLDLLKEYEDRVRYRTRLELSGRKSEEVVAAVDRWLGQLNANEPDYERLVLEGLWLHQAHNAVDAGLLQKVLRSRDFRIRAAAVRVLCAWRDRLPGSLEMIKRLAADDSPRVRLEAVRAASFYPVSEAVEAALVSLEHPTDEYLDYTRSETLKTLEPYWKPALLAGKTGGVPGAAGLQYLVGRLSTTDLLQLLKREANRVVGFELLFRPGLRDEQRREALSALANVEHKSEVQLLVAAIRNQQQQTGAREDSVAFDLARLLTSGRPAPELARFRDDLEQLARQSTSPVHREIGYVALVTADGSVDRAWALASQSITGLLDLVHAMPAIPDPGLRAALYKPVAALLDGLPKSLHSAAAKKQTLGRYVRIELAGKRSISLAEVEVYSDGRNVALQGKASQKSTAREHGAQLAIDGKADGNAIAGGLTQTEDYTIDPWWEVDLGREYPIESVAIFNRTDSRRGKRLDGFALKVLDGQRNEVFVAADNPAPDKMVSFEIGGESAETHIRRGAMLALTSVRGQEGATFKRLARLVANADDRAGAVSALQRIPQAQWPAEEAQPLADMLLAYIRELPAARRTAPEALEALQLGFSLAALLPAETARKVRHELGELGVQIIRVGTLTDRMLFDKDRLAVQAGKPVQFIFENTDIMPHNFVIVRPGKLEEVGMSAESQATQPGALERHFVPASKAILLSSHLLQPRQSQKLAFTAPKQPGIYPYVCTYPGHWRRMFGALYVVADLESYLAGPEQYLASHPLPIRDDLLKLIGPRKEWKLEDLAGSVEQLHGRNFANGRQMFQVAGCVACHKLNGTGQAFGPDLAQLDTKLTALDILKEIIDPSQKINEKFQSYTFETKAGKIITGIVLEETTDAYKIIENPVLKAEPVVLKKTEMAEREKSLTSLMPKGLFDRLSHDEILDLLAYVAARGNEKSPHFSAGHVHHGAGH